MKYQFRRYIHLSWSEYSYKSLGCMACKQNFPLLSSGYHHQQQLLMSTSIRDNNNNCVMELTADYCIYCNNHCIADSNSSLYSYSVIMMSVRWGAGKTHNCAACSFD